MAELLEKYTGYEYDIDDFRYDVRKAMEKSPYVDKNDCIEMYWDSPELSQKEAAKFFLDDKETPWQKFDEYLLEYEDYCHFTADDKSECIWEYLPMRAKEYYGEWPGDENCKEVIDEEICFCIPEDNFNKEVLVNILLDVGNGNHDFDDDTPFYSGRLKETSSMRFLAKVQGCEDEFLQCLRAALNGQEYHTDSEFIKTAINEFEDSCYDLNTVTFCVRMKLFDLFDVWEEIHHHPDGMITVTKDACTGLFNPWNGGGSLLEVKLDKDVHIPCRYIFSIAPDSFWDVKGYYDVMRTYGACSSMWKGSVSINQFE